MAPIEQHPLVDQARCENNNAMDKKVLGKSFHWPDQKSMKYGQWSWRQLMRRKILLLMAVAVLLIYVHLTLQKQRDEDYMSGLNMENIIPVRHRSHVLGMGGFLVWSDQCKISNLDPYKPEVMRHFKRSKYKPCSTRKPLTNVGFDEATKRYVLSINGRALDSYDIDGSLRCCWMGIERQNETNVNYTDCENFKRRVQLPNTTDSIIVKCFSGANEIYINAHAMVPERSDVRERLQNWTKKEAPSVLMIGIDSISRVNLIRAMPKTAQYLYDNSWFELAGYNKIEDNTFPNIMALATGYNLSEAISKCRPDQEGGLDKCEFIWQLYRDHGYVTAYGEDAVVINTFNYLKKGFKDPPVDYYMRPYLFAAEKLLSMTVVSGLPHCLGYKHAAEHVYDYALEFARRFKDDTYFGFFWTNTHSHSDISQSTTMDVYLRDYLQELVQLGTMNNTIVIFFSDHGLRFGPTRATWSGHMEERLPFIFIWLPPSVRNAHPEFVSALTLNRNRLTNPYDLHMTLKHILRLSGRVPSKDPLGGPARACAQCHSLLRPVAENRSCADIGIADHWCTCHPYDVIYTDSKTVHMLAKRVVLHINKFVAEFHNGSYAKLCQPLSYMSVKSAYRAQRNVGDLPHVNTYRLLFYTRPNKALYEATVRYNDQSDVMQVTGGVSRLNMYNGEADCMMDFAPKKYCYCRNRSG
ncbi:uncharacterized protein LOC115622456 isoform X2 [Scaptodrosophila lebanonensis]|uniref:Uncharacterized protein LOC115622456 isoform X2 n=1 Tax=Drosophila lebanonensis TaxID=7225 RepID=A0A6J2T8D9_DROLE|nr:uncharacterized protein LOC115622456 isoform X2 [Scaptodrosophila lebanonensis]